MDIHDKVRAHYSGTELAELVLAAARETASDPGVEELARFDQLHAGFLPATRHLLESLDVDAGTRLLDVGCGLGGATRVAAHDYRCRATGLDLSPDFVDSARELTRVVGLDGLVTYIVGDGASLPFDDASFDVVTMIHVGMNVPDKTALFREVHRVLVPGGRFGVYDQMRRGDGPLTYPMPWAVDGSSSFVEMPEDYVTALMDCGFGEVDLQDRTAAVAGPEGPGPQGSRVPVFGPDFIVRIQNNIAATKAGLLGAIQILARRES